MQLTQDTSKGNYQIQSYEPGRLIVNNITHTRSVIVSAQTLTEWQPQSINELVSTDFRIIIEQEPELVLLGTGEHMILLPDSVFEHLINRNIGFEVMSTGAACRTFSILLAEDRKVIAALMV